MIQGVVLEVLSSNQRLRLLEAGAGSGAAAQEAAPPGPSLPQGEAELAYLTHEGLFISDALNEARQQAAREQSPPEQSRAEAAGGGDSAVTSVSREQSLLYVGHASADPKRGSKCSDVL